MKTLIKALLIAVLLALNTGAAFAAEEPHAFLELGDTPSLTSKSGYPLIVGTQGNDDFMIMVENVVIDTYDAETVQRLTSFYQLFGSTTALEADATTATTAIPFVSVVGSSGVRSHLALVQNVASAQGADIVALKTRAAAGQTDADVIVSSGDDVLKIRGYGSNGATYDELARITFESGGTPGASADMPGQILFHTTPDGSATPTLALTIEPDQDLVITGDIVVADGGGLGLTVANGANAACDTTCTTGCVAGFDAGTSAFVACATATADTCLCTK